MLSDLWFLLRLAWKHFWKLLMFQIFILLLLKGKPMPKKLFERKISPILCCSIWWNLQWMIIGFHTNWMLKYRCLMKLICLGKLPNLIVCNVFRLWSSVQNLIFDRKPWLTNYGHTKVKSLILCGPNEYFGCEYEGLVFCRNNSWLMENMGKWLTVPKCVLINQPKIPQIPQNLSAHKFGISMKKGFIGCS